MSGSIRKRGRRSWQVQVELGRDPVTGDRWRRFFSVKGTKKDAERALTEATHQRDTGIDLRPGQMTVSEYLDRWLRDYAKNNVAASTYEGYAAVVRLHLKPGLGAVKLAELRPAHIQAAYGLSLERDLSASSVRQHHRVLSQALKHAVRWQLIARNPCDGVTSPRPTRREMRVIDEAGVRRLLEAAEGTGHEALINLAISTGARQGELLALRWSDVDFEGGSMQIVRTARYFVGKGVEFSEPKTHRSRRPVALSEATLRVLRTHRTRQNERRLLVGPAWTDFDLVFPSKIGTPMYARNLVRFFRATVDEAGIGPLRFHDLRHTAATLMLKKKVNPKVVSERLGHATVGFTLDAYSHVLPDMQEEAAASLDSVLRPLDLSKAAQ